VLEPYHGARPLCIRHWRVGAASNRRFFGAYAANGSVADLVILVVGLLGYAMRVYDLPVALVIVLVPTDPAPCARPRYTFTMR